MPMLLPLGLAHGVLLIVLGLVVIADAVATRLQ
jgi:hypothetical protein